jgi:hypothetical protein
VEEIMKGATKSVKVTITAVMEIPAETDNEQLKTVLPQSVFEAFWTQIGRPDDVEVLQIDDTILTDKRLTLSEKAYLSALLSMDREEKQLVLQNLRSGQVSSEKLTDGRLIADINHIDSIAQKLDIQI